MRGKDLHEFTPRTKSSKSVAPQFDLTPKALAIFSPVKLTPKAFANFSPAVGA
jgi:hypothetical protein